MRKVILLLLFIPLLLSCSSSDDEVNLVQFGYKSNYARSGASFYIFPSGEYDHIERASLSDFISGKPIAVAYKSDGTAVNPVYNYSIGCEYGSYADYTDKGIPYGTFCVFCVLVGQEEYYSNIITISKSCSIIFDASNTSLKTYK